MRKRSLLRCFSFIGLGAVILVILLSVIGNVAYAAGLVDETINTQNLYSKYSLDHYQLDFYVDNAWDWLPWNWSDGIGKSVMYGLYAITNFIWTVSLYLSNATGYVIQEAYKLDFISDTADAIGGNIQTLAGVTSNGFSGEGFYVGFLLLFILLVGIYVAYTGLMKRESSKAISAVLNFVTVFLLSASFIAYAPSFITKINDFSTDISESALALGTKIVVPSSQSSGKDSVDLIRDSLFSIQVQQPWLLLQYGNSNQEEIGNDRVESLLSISPDTNNGEDREKAVKTEIEDQKNTNLTLTKTMNRLGTVVFLFLFNLGISIFIFLLTGIMIFSQVLFIIFAMFLPISFLLSMLPTYEGMAKKALERLFNTIMMRAGITLVITTAFSISSMFYTISTGYPFFMVAFLQIVTFAGVYFKLGDLMSLFKLQSSDSQQMGRRILRQPSRMMHRSARHVERKLGRALAFGGIGATIGNKLAKKNSPAKTPYLANRSTVQPVKESLRKRAGQKMGAVTEMSKQMKSKAQTISQQVRETPLQAQYAVYSGVKKKEQAKENVSDFKRDVIQQKQEQHNARQVKQQQREQGVAQKCHALNQIKNKYRPNIASKNPRKIRIDRQDHDSVDHKPITREPITPRARRKHLPKEQFSGVVGKTSYHVPQAPIIEKKSMLKENALAAPTSRKRLVLKRKGGEHRENKTTHYRK